MSLIINAIILRVTPFKERGLILSLISEEEGLLSAIVSTSKKTLNSGLSLLLQSGEKTKDRKGDLYIFQELEGVKWFLGIRENPQAIRALRSMGKALTKALIEEVPAPMLYALFLKIIEGLDQGKDPETLEALFHVKLALHEGQLPVEGFTPSTAAWIEQAKKSRSLQQVPKVPSSAVLKEICKMTTRLN